METEQQTPQADSGISGGLYTSNQLRNVLLNFGTPDRSVVGKLPKGGTQLDFVGHADVTKMLIEIDPLWSWEPVAWENGRPAINIVNGNATMWGRLTLLGKSLVGVGSVDSKKVELDKELVSDFIRNAAMRFGVCLSLWTKSEWESSPVAPATPVDPDPVVSAENIERFKQACVNAGLDAMTVAVDAGVLIGGEVRESGRVKLLASFNKLKAEKVLTGKELIALLADKAVTALPESEILTVSGVVSIADSLTERVTAYALAASKQITALRALLRGHGVLATADQLAAVGTSVGHVVESLSELTGTEAAHVIATYGKTK